MGDRTGNGGKIKKAKGRIKKKPPSSLRRAKEDKNAEQKSPGFGGELDTAADRRGYNGCAGKPVVASLCRGVPLFDCSSRRMGRVAPDLRRRPKPNTFSRRPRLNLFEHFSCSRN
ncbi:MAG: hypothetical protein QOH31_6460 [Verrucomicrobiota bacterium]